MRNGLVVAIAVTAAAGLSACGDTGSAEEPVREALHQAQQAAQEAMALASEAVDEMDDMADRAMASNAGQPPEAVARLEPVAGSGVDGRVSFNEIATGIQVRAHVTGLAPGQHAVHVHQNGDCSNQARAAGPHLEFSTDSAGEIHGNLGELTAAEGGTDVELTVLHIPLSEILGHAVIVHADGNNPAKPPGGAAGARIACGVVEKTG